MSLTGLTILLVAIGVLTVATLVGLVMVLVLDRDDQPPLQTRKSPTPVRAVTRPSGSPPAAAHKKAAAISVGSKNTSPTTSVGASAVKKSTAPAVAKKVSPTVPKKVGIPNKPAAAKHSVGSRVRIVNRPGYEGRIGKIIGIGPLYLKLRMEDDGDVLIVGQVNAVPARDTQRVASGAPPMKPVVDVKPKPAPTAPPSKASPPGKVVAAKRAPKRPTSKAPVAATENAALPRSAAPPSAEQPLHGGQYDHRLSPAPSASWSATGGGLSGLWKGLSTPWRVAIPGSAALVVVVAIWASATHGFKDTYSYNAGHDAGRDSRNSTLIYSGHMLPLSVCMDLESVANSSSDAKRINSKDFFDGCMDGLRDLLGTHEFDRVGVENSNFVVR